MPRSSTDVKALAVLLLASGAAHLIRPRPFESIVPKLLPHKRALVYASGAVELGCAAALTAPRTRRAGGYGAAALLVAVLPANVQMAVDAHGSSRTSRAYRLATLARLPLQAPLVWAALRATRQV